MRIHFIGIGGISMSALAKICLNRGDKVSGSDFKDSKSLDSLRKAGAKIIVGHSESNIPKDVNLVVYTAAISEDNEELAFARKMDVEVIDRASFLGRLMGHYENSIGVSGTHGKTSTTSMASVIFNNSKMDPTILVGGNLKSIGGNLQIGNSQNFITEACEYVDSFLKFYPRIATISNIEADHLDYFSGIDQIRQSFRRYALNVPADGFVICNGDDENVILALEGIERNIITFGQDSKNKCVIKNVSFEGTSSHFDLSLYGEDLGRFELKVPGIHNVYNSTSAILAALYSDIDLEDIRSSIRLYKGVDRRFEIKGGFDGVSVIDDYAHHPTEIKTTLASAKNVCKKDIYCVFQPHTYTRTRTLLDEFSNAFYDASHVLILDIYAAREKDPGDIHSKDLVSKLEKNGVKVKYMQDFNETVDYLSKELKTDDMLITMGAGDVFKIGEMLLEKKSISSK